MPEMRRVTVRFGESLWALIEDEANTDAVSAAQWIREAAIMRCLWERRLRGLEIGPEILRLVRAQQYVGEAEVEQVIADVREHAQPELDKLLERLPADTAEIVRGWYGL